MDTKHYPQGSGTIKTKYDSGVLKFYDSTGVTEIKRMDPTQGIEVGTAHGVVQCIRTRAAVATVNAGFTLLAGITGYKYRIVSAIAIAYGGAVGTVTTVDLLGLQATSSVKLVAWGQANLTQSTVVRMGDTGGTVLADGASHVACDSGGAITVDITGSAADTATGIDFIVQYVIEAA